MRLNNSKPFNGGQIQCIIHKPQPQPQSQISTLKPQSLRFLDEGNFLQSKYAKQKKNRHQRVISGLILLQNGSAFNGFCWKILFTAPLPYCILL